MIANIYNEKEKLLNYAKCVDTLKIKPPFTSYLEFLACIPKDCKKAAR